MKSKFMPRMLATVALGAFCVGGTTVFAENVIKLIPDEILSIASSDNTTLQSKPTNWEPIAPIVPIVFDSQAGWDLQRPQVLPELPEQTAIAVTDVVTEAVIAATEPQPTAAITPPSPASTAKAAIVNKAQTKAAAKAPAATPTPAPSASAKKQAAPASGSTANAQTMTIKDVQGQTHSYKKVINAKASAYSSAPEENGNYGAVDYYGNALKLGTIAVDPSVIPLGTTVLIQGYSFDGLPQSLVAKASDIGGAIKGNRVDIFIPGSSSYVRGFGIQNVEIYVLN
ncbi:MAG: hypothetical protein K0R67_1126 [Paenibacillus sp.]|nr:hypothetical protein [Paenibacillus sp.]